VNSPGHEKLAATAFIIGMKTIPETSGETVPRRVDLSGLALITLGIGLFTFAFDRAPDWGWLSAPVIGVFLLSVALLAAFVAVETRVRFPLINLSLLRNARFTTLVVAGTVANIAYVVTVFLSTMNLQQVRGLDPLMAGLAFLGPSVGAALGGPVSGRLASRNKPFAVMGIGCTAAAASLAVLAAANNFAVYLAALTACGFTMGFVYAFTTVATQAVVAPERAGEAAGVTLTSLVTLAGVGVAVSSSVLEVLEHHRIGFVTVLRAGIVCAVTVVALLAVFTLERNMIILIMIGFGAAMGVTLTPLAALGVIQVPEDEPGSLPGICNAAFGIGGSLGFTWAGTVVGEGTKATYHSALWICVAIGIAAFATSMILKPRSAPVVPAASRVSVHTTG